MPDDHADRGDDTCLACHDVEPTSVQVTGDSPTEQGRAIWQERPGLSCRNCHGRQAEGSYGPSLAQTDLDWATFSQRTRTPLSDRMPPIGTALDDPAFEKGGTWIGDQDLQLVHAWLASIEPGPIDELSPEAAAPCVPSGLESQEECLLCHGAEGTLPVPEDHQGWGNEMCLTCHPVQESE
jgi:mono/diheme cytochrome c family protein